MLAKKQKKITVDNFLNMKFTDDNIYELIDGFIMMSPRPSEKHMIVQSNIVTEINLYFKSRKKHCRAIFENMLKSDDYSYIIPDVMVKCADENNDNILTDKPFIVIEVLSPSNMSNDLIVKLNKYKDLEIPEYWIVDPKSKEITVHDFVNNKSKRYYYHDDEKQITSNIISDMQINIEDIFR